HVTFEADLAAARRTAAVTRHRVAVVAVFQAYDHTVATQRGALRARSRALPTHLGFTQLVATITRCGVGVIAGFRAVDVRIAAVDHVNARLAGSWARPVRLEEALLRATVARHDIAVVAGL